MGWSAEASTVEVWVASNFQSARAKPVVRAVTSSCKRSPAGLLNWISAVPHGKPLQLKPYFARIGRGFGNEGGEDAVIVDSHELAPVAV